MHSMPYHVFEELLAYVGFGASDAEALHQLHAIARPHFARIADAFYARILEHPDARRVLDGGETEIGRLRKLLVEWMESTLLGPWDAAYFERRARIGRTHVRVGLPQHYMFGAMNLLRRELGALVDADRDGHPERAAALRAALDRILDVELGVMLNTYRADQETQRLTGVQTLTAGLSQEIRNPLNAASLQLAVLERRIRRMPVKDQVDSLQPLVLVQDEIRRLDHLLENFLQFARPHGLEREPVVIGPLVRRVAELLATDAERRGVHLTLRLESGLKARGDESRLREVVMNLVLNALDASIQGGEVRLSARKVNPEQLELRVEDAGQGVKPELREQIFQPFFTTKPQGSGLGLAIVQTIVAQHGGAVRLDASELGGASFRVQLPTA
jgi:two-component system, NtrC family, sensor histidine kinase HydH